ncbi:MAG: preprotein translocase subunit YajC [Clostridiales bacterium]|nr:preprotein translocase subunit YajC [Clostridiales bacterium]
MRLFLQATDGFDISTIGSFILPIAVTALVFYFMLIRPEQKRKKSVQKMLSELKVGDEVTTRGGIVGKIVKIKDDKLTIETGSEHAKIQIMRWAVMSTGSDAGAPQI